MPRVRLFHWNATEAEERAARLQAAGYDVDYESFAPSTLRDLRTDLPEAVVIDLDRLPSRGRDVAVALRAHKATRGIPLVFVAGGPEKVEPIKELLPDAVFTTWRRIRSSLKYAILHPPEKPVAHRSVMAGYSGVRLPKKLGIKENAVVALVGAPRGFEDTLGELPEGVKLRRQARGRCDLIIWFTRSSKDLQRHITRMGSRVGRDGLWIVWPKKASGVATDLTQAVVRRIGLGSGLVDYKVCAIDGTWAGLKFSRRKQK